MPKEPSVRIRENPWPVLNVANQPALVFAVIFVAIFLLHAPLLHLPYFWDEAGYYVPAARDILLTGSLIPHSTVSNAHPPLVMAWVALWWKLTGFAPLVTRAAMLVVAAFALLGLFRLAERAANTEVAIASTVLTALYPVFFAQSSLAHVDLAAAGLTFWGLCAFLEERWRATAMWLSLAVLAKETAIIGPLALAAWELVGILVAGASKTHVGTAALGRPVERSSTASMWGPPPTAVQSNALRRFLPLLSPILPLTLWYSYHYLRTGYVFGNPEFFRYNVAATLNPVRFLLALALRLWQTFGYMHLWILTLGLLLAMLLPPIIDHVGTAAPGCPGERSSPALERERIPLPTQMIFYAVIAAYVLAMSLIGGAVLARYMLPAVPLVIIVAVSTLRRRLPYWRAAIAIIALAFIAAWFWNPPYGFSPEDNLAYRDYIVLHQDAERFLEARYPMARVLTAWPASGELSQPWLGYITRPMQVVRIEDFSLEQVISAADFLRSDFQTNDFQTNDSLSNDSLSNDSQNNGGRQTFDVALVFSTKYDPPLPRWTRRRSLASVWNDWESMKRRFFGFHHDVPPAAAAQILGGRIVFSEEHKGQWVAVIEVEKREILNATVFGGMSPEHALVMQQQDIRQR